MRQRAVAQEELEFRDNVLDGRDTEKDEEEDESTEFDK